MSAAAESVATHCPYCALQCGLVARTAPTLSVVGDRAFPVNEGALCVKGWTAAAVVDHPDRLRQPLARDAPGALVPVGWDYALDRIAPASATPCARTARTRSASSAAAR